jgi:hypothetical protein
LWWEGGLSTVTATRCSRAETFLNISQTENKKEKKKNPLL